MKHLEDIQIGEIEISIYESKSEFIIDMKNKEGELLEGRVLNK